VFENFLQKLFFNQYPRLDWIQIEVSSACGAECIYCPRHAYQKNWISRILDDNLYKLLQPAFQKTRLVYLQGWGEPFTHPDFFKLAGIAKKAGSQVGTTTNGMLINQQLADQIVDQGIDILCFSMAGLGEKNDVFRKGAPLKKVLRAIECVHRAKHKYKTKLPNIHIAYMLLRSGLNDLEKLPNFLSETGVDQTVISSLSLVTRQELIRESILADSEEEWTGLKKRLLDLRIHAESLNTDIHFHIVSMFAKRTTCSENISRAFVIGSDGSISPCVMKNLPIHGKISYYFNGRETVYQPLHFGNISQGPIHAFWNSHSYRNFRKDSLRYSTALCANCHKQFIDPITPVLSC